MLIGPDSLNGRNPHSTAATMAGRRPSMALQPRPPTGSLPSLRNLDSLTEALIVAAVDNLVALYCPLSSSVLALKNKTSPAISATTNLSRGSRQSSITTSTSSGITSGISTGCATPCLLVPAVDSGYDSGVEGDNNDKEESDAALLDASLQQQSSVAALRADAFEKSYAERWLTTLIARIEELPFFYDGDDEQNVAGKEEENREDGDFRRQRLVDTAAVVLASFHNALDDEEDDEGVVRNLIFPLPSSTASISGNTDIRVQLKDGALSSTDHTDVGLQSWGASIVFSELACSDPARFELAPEKIGSSAPRICELGAGTGLVSLTLGKLLPRFGVANATIVATDYHAAVLDNLKVNITTNFPGSTSTTPPPVQACALDWSTPDFSSPLDKPFDILVATDVIYEPLHAIWLRDCAARMLNANGVFWLMATVRQAGKFQGISDTVRTAFEAEGCPTLSSAADCEVENSKVLKIMEEQALERPRGVGHGQEVGYKLFRIAWA